jgi:deazaflavin-dependent oxidoreductase (nitroreductase family)
LSPGLKHSNLSIKVVLMNIEPHRVNWFSTAMKKMLASRLGSWLFRPTLHLLDRAALKLSRGKHTLTGLLGGVPVITLTTTGARSGKSRSVPLVGLPHQGSIILIASNFGQSFHPAWYLNLKAHPAVSVTYKDRSEPYRAREVHGEERDLCWQKAVDCYSGYDLYQQRAGNREIPVVLLDPT